MKLLGKTKKTKKYYFSRDSVNMEGHYVIVVGNGKGANGSDSPLYLMDDSLKMSPTNDWCLGVTDKLEHALICDSESRALLTIKLLNEDMSAKMKHVTDLHIHALKITLTVDKTECFPEK